MKKKAAIYTRVSTGHEEQFTSLDNQRKYYTDYCRNKGYELFKIYADEGLSATSPNRKMFLEMIKDGGVDYSRDQETNKVHNFKSSKRKPKFDYIVTKDVSRFARNTNAKEIAHALRDKGVYIIFENAGFSTEDDDWEFRLSLFLTFSQQESIDRSKKVAFAYKQRANEKKFHLPHILYGYYRDEETDEYKIDTIESEVVKDIFDMYVNQKYGTKQIANTLNERGIKPRSNKLWRATTIKRMIRNEKYKGQVILRRLTNTGVTGSNKVIKRDENEWKVIDDAMPVIIDEDTWQKAQDILDNRVNEMPDGSKYGSKIVQNIFHEKITCPTCYSKFIRVSGTKLRKSGKKVTEYNYYCRNRRMFKTCDNKGISHNVLIREIEYIASHKMKELININVEREKRFAQIVFERLEQKKKDSEQIKAEIQKKIDLKTDDINKLFNVFLKSDISQTVIEVTNRKIEEIEKERKELELEKLSYDTSELDKFENRINSQLSKIAKLSKKEKFTFDEALELITNIVIYNDNRILFHIGTPSVSPYALDENFDNVEDQYALLNYEIKVD
ncbi:recombinase family protein [Schinkia azotoformans]|uniref:recombinase family protein n=1 Tax=Schinkia azotoformans TaxID=1454 RepID=UPI002DC01447|nr:recombinase family protein [Schinkia azotoformans]MEC1778383.1 recombinase family protein [Schinkia azotoformans]MED4328372.1 recombinase family protein [Schinkia azotoformans]